MPSGAVSTPPTLLGARIRDLRTARGWSQWTLAKVADTRPNRVSCWETGLHEPTLPVLARLAAAFGLTVSELLAGVM